MLIRSEPFREFDRLTEAMFSERWARQIPVDAYRRNNEFTVHFDLPGVDARFIDMTVEKDLLTVRATRGWVRAEGDQIQIAERAQGEFSRQLFLGEGLDRDHINANYGKWCAHRHHPRRRRGQTPKGRDHQRRRRDPGRHSRLHRRVTNRHRPNGTAPSQAVPLQGGRLSERLSRPAACCPRPSIVSNTTLVAPVGRRAAQPPWSERLQRRWARLALITSPHAPGWTSTPWPRPAGQATPPREALEQLSSLRSRVPPPRDRDREVALSCCLRDNHSCRGVELDSELDDMLLLDKFPHRFQYCANSRLCGLKSFVQARLRLEHPYLVARDALRANGVFRDLHEHWAVPGFELNDLGHMNRLGDRFGSRPEFGELWYGTARLGRLLSLARRRPSNSAGEASFGEAM